jgi:hypothetical protein
MSFSQPPTGPSPLNYVTPPSGPNLRTIATKQRAIIFCILGYIVLVVSQFLLPPALRLLIGLLVLAVGITATVFVFMLTTTIYSTGVGVVLGILTLIPLIGLIVLLVVNSKATNLLRENGIKVGLLGADMSQTGLN